MHRAETLRTQDARASYLFHPAGVRRWVQRERDARPELRAIAEDVGTWRALNTVMTRQRKTATAGEGARRVVGHLLTPQPDDMDGRLFREALAALPVIWMACSAAYGTAAAISVSDLAVLLNVARGTAGRILGRLVELGAIRRDDATAAVSLVYIRPGHATVPPEAERLTTQFADVADAFASPGLRYGSVLIPGDLLVLTWAALGREPYSFAPRTLRDARARLHSAGITDLYVARDILDSDTAATAKADRAHARRADARAARTQEIELLRDGTRAARAADELARRTPQQPRIDAVAVSTAARNIVCDIQVELGTPDSAAERAAWAAAAAPMLAARILDQPTGRAARIFLADLLRDAQNPAAAADHIFDLARKDVA